MSNAAFNDFDDLLNASMDDLDDLPPVGVPPTGYYDLVVTAERVDPEEAGKNPYIKFSYVVEAIHEIQNPEEEAQAAVGMKFSQIFSPFKKNGTKNDLGIGFLKEAIAPFSAHFDIPQVGEVLNRIHKVSVAASLVRKQDRKDPERFNFNLRDVVIL